MKARLHNLKCEFEIRKDLASKFDFFIYSFHDQGLPKQFLFSKQRLPEGTNTQHIEKYTTQNNDYSYPQETTQKIQGWVKNDAAKNEYWERVPAMKYTQTPTNKTIQQINHNRVCNEYKLDTLLTQKFNADFFVFDKDEIEPQKIMPYAANTILFTNTKTGKTSISQRIGEYSSRAKTANLLGFSTADSSNFGSLHESNMPWYIDEVQEQKGQQLHNELLTILEQGSTNIHTGKRSISCEFWGSINWMSNPKRREGFESAMIYRFMNMLETVCDNAQAFGSRMAFFLFTKNLQTAEYDSEIEINEIKNQEEYDTLRELTKKPFTQLFIKRDVRKWLNKPHDKEYQKLIEEMIERAAEFEIASDFMEGMLHNHRHARGLALRHALLPKTNELIEGNIQTDELLENSEREYANLQVIQIDSFKCLGNFVTPEAIEAQWKSWFEKESQETKAILLELIEKDETAIYLTQLKPAFKKARGLGDLLGRVNPATFDKYEIFAKHHKQDILFNISDLPKLRRLLKNG